MAELTEDIWFFPHRALSRMMTIGMMPIRGDVLKLAYPIGAGAEDHIPGDRIYKKDDKLFTDVWMLYLGDHDYRWFDNEIECRDAHTIRGLPHNQTFDDEIVAAQRALSSLSSANMAAVTAQIAALNTIAVNRPEQVVTMTTGKKKKRRLKGLFGKPW